MPHDSTLRSKGVRKSDFPSKTTLPSALFLDFVVDGANFRISLADFQTALNVTGTIVQLGTGTPVLRVSDSVNEIRDIIAGAGISVKVDASENVEIAVTNDVPDAIISMQGNAVNTVIATQSVFVKVAGVFITTRVTDMTHDGTGKLTYTAADNANAGIMFNLTIDPVAAIDIEVSAQIAINGVLVAGSNITTLARSGVKTALQCIWKPTLSKDDFVEIFIANETDTTDLLVSSAVGQVN